MTTKETHSDESRPAHQAIVWIDHDRAVIVSPELDALESVEWLQRRVGESPASFQARAVDRVIEDDRVMVAGPAFARTSFERAYVAVTHRPDRLFEIEPRFS